MSTSRGCSKRPTGRSMRPRPAAATAPSRPRATAAGQYAAAMAGTASRRYDAALAALVAATTLVHWLLIRQGGFFLDDFRNLADARRLGLTPKLLGEPLFEHFAPGHRLL